MSERRPGRGLDVLRRAPWWLLLAGWVAAYLAGLLGGLVVKALGWWSGRGWETDVLRAVHGTVSPVLDPIFLTVPWAGTNYTLAPLVAIAAVWLVLKGKPVTALHLAVVQVGSSLLNPALKFSLVRARPTIYEMRGQFALPSFPSGHAIAMTAVVLTAAILVYRTGHHVWALWVAGVFWAIVMYSRLYLSVHWPTDVIVGVIVGAVWLWATMRAFRPLHEAMPGA